MALSVAPKQFTALVLVQAAYGQPHWANSKSATTAFAPKQTMRRKGALSGYHQRLLFLSVTQISVCAVKFR